MKNISGMLILTVLLAGCQSIQYYAQAVGGQINILSHQRSIQAVIVDDSIAEKTRKQLEQVASFRHFAASTLKLPENKSYTRYVDLGRDYVVWNVVATPRYSVEPLTACFLIVGCLSYRGYFSKQDALSHAKQLKADGLDVHVGGVSAYSTLGWMADPVLNTMLARSEAAMAGLIFHELAHQQLYIKGDTKFNESFASAVEAIGLRQWAKAQANREGVESYFSDNARQADVIKVILAARTRMQEAYGLKEDESELENIKQAQFDLLKIEYQQLKHQGGGTEGFDRFFASKLNHASLALFGEYHGWVGAFERLFEQNNRQWGAFYKAAKVLGNAPRALREKQLAALQDYLDL